MPHGELPKTLGGRVTCGVARYGVDLRIVDPETRIECAPHVEGEIWVNSTCKALGYWNKPELSAQTFHASIVQYCPRNDGVINVAPADGYLRTGDRGFLSDDGYLMISGRIKDMIIVNGRKFWPTDIERTVQESQAQVRYCLQREFSKDLLFLSRSLQKLRPGCIAAFAIQNMDLSPPERLVIVAELRDVPSKKLAEARELFAEMARQIRAEVITCTKRREGVTERSFVRIGST